MAKTIKNEFNFQKISGVYHNKTYLSACFDKSNSDNALCNAKYYLCKGIIGSEMPPLNALMLISAKNNKLLYASDFRGSEDDFFSLFKHNLEQEQIKQKRIEHYSGREYIFKLPSEEQALLEHAVTVILKEIYKEKYMSGERSQKADMAYAMNGRLQDLEEILNWRSILSEAYGLLREIQVRDALYSTALDGANYYLEDLDDAGMDAVITEAADIYMNNEFDEKRLFCDMRAKLDLLLTDAYYGYISVKEMDNLE